MRILDKYIARHVAGGVLFALAVLLSLTAAASFVDELDSVARGRYAIGSAIAFVLLTLPRHAFVLFPYGAAIGALIGLGTLTASTELVVVRAAGVSTGRIVGSALKGALALAIIAILCGEVVALYCEDLARSRRTAALDESSKREDGFWIRDGQRFVNVLRVRPGNRIEDMFIYELGAEGVLRTVTHAKHVKLRDAAWMLESVRRSDSPGGDPGRCDRRIIPRARRTPPASPTPRRRRTCRAPLPGTVWPRDR